MFKDMIQNQLGTLSNLLMRLSNVRLPKLIFLRHSLVNLEFRKTSRDKRPRTALIARMHPILLSAILGNA